MASISRRAALNLLRPTLRSFATAPTPGASTSPTTPPTPPKSTDAPKYSPPAVFPPPVNPFTQPEKAGDAEKPVYSSTQRKLVRGIARMMGYNSRASTAIRETSRMMKGIVEAVERDRDFWYEECRLPPTYQTFFQLHLLYVLTLLPRIRALPADMPSHNYPIPEPSEPTPPQHTPEVPPEPQSSVAGILTKAHYEAYQAELINHFFEMAESQMRRVLGRGERERIIKKYMAEMGEQWKGAGVGLDYAMGLSNSANPEESSRADAELASWVWRNLFGARGLGAPAGMVDPSVDELWLKEVDMAEQLELVVRFIRREQARLDGISHRDVLDANIGSWGCVRE